MAPPAPTLQPAGREAVAGEISRALPSLSADWTQALASALIRGGISTPKDRAAFLSQCLAETGGFKLARENLNYRVDALLSKFGRNRISEADARRLGRKPDEAPLSLERQMAIANLIYGGEYGRINLGNAQPEDGWFFRGAPLLQLTGRVNWTRYGISCGKSVVELSTYLMTNEGAADSAAWFWRVNGLSDIANALPEKDGELSDTFRRLTIRINGGTNGLDDRKAAYRATRAAFSAG